MFPKAHDINQSINQLTNQYCLMRLKIDPCLHSRSWDRTMAKLITSNKLKLHKK